jgi:hypothetical protein
VSGVDAKPVHPDAPPPRVLRSTDGTHFEAILQDPGTLLGDFDRASLRGMAVYKQRLYLVAGAVHGSGTLWEAENPAGGKRQFLTGQSTRNARI